MDTQYDPELRPILDLFHKDGVETADLKEIRVSEEDSRWMLYVTCQGAQYVIKLAANSFTTPERVAAWPGIINAYRDLGCYSPAMVKSLSGNYAEICTFRGITCVVWEEEFSKYPTRDSLEKALWTNPDGRFTYHDNVLALLGKIGEAHFDMFPWPSGWVRLTPMAPADEVDEVTMCVEEFDHLVRTKAPQWVSRWEGIYKLFQENQAALAELYPRLPTSVFQGDFMGDNILLDENGQFRGLLDYNLSGKDTVLNMFFSTILYGYSYQRTRAHSPEELPHLNDTTQDSVLKILLDSLKYLRNFYTFSPVEAEAAPLLLKYIYTVQYDQIRALMDNLENPHKLKLLFDFMEQQLLRNDIDFHGAMMA